jgi:hypothetical protein
MEREIKTNLLKKDLKKTFICVLLVIIVLLMIYFLNLKTEFLSQITNFIIQ